MLATSTASVMPAGGVQVAALLKEWEVTSMVLATMVLTLRVECVKPLRVFWPFSTLMGAAVSTPEKVWIPPADPVEVEKVHE